MPRSAVIRTVLFDADGVLQYPPGFWPERMLRLTGMPTWKEQSAVEDPLLAGGDPVAAFTAGFPDRTVSVEEILDAWNDTVLDAQALELVDRVRAGGVRCVLASNQQRHRAAWMRTQPLLRHLDAAYFSCEIGAAKPSAGFFRHILDAEGAVPAEVLFIDDHPGNVAGARALGIVAEHKSNAVGVRRLREILNAHGLL